MADFDLFGGGGPPERPKQSSVWSVSDLTDEIKDLLESKIGDLQVTGEISNLRRQSSGHIYFSLKDENAQISAVMFRGDASRLGFNPEDGDQVVATGMVTVYKPRGSYQIRIRSLKQAGKGGLQAQFEALKAKLNDEGLFDAAKKKHLPDFPRRIGVITSPTGAAVKDFLQVLGRRCPHIEVVVGGVRVQGDGAAEEVADMLETFNRRADVDLIVVTRGGGSLEDLWAFNEEVVARAIAACDLPVVSAVGHEIDFTIADFVADMRAPTPSAAAEQIATARDEWLERLGELQRRLRHGLMRQITEHRATLNQYQSHYVFKEPVRLVETALQRVDEQRERIQVCLLRSVEMRRENLVRLQGQLSRMDAKRLLRGKRQQVQALDHQMRLLSPQGVLDRGYTLTFDGKGRLVRGIDELKSGDEVRVQVRDGRIHAKVDKKSDQGLIDAEGEKARR